jgi:preprotein translocase subunit YajC
MRYMRKLLGHCSLGIFGCLVTLERAFGQAAPVAAAGQPESPTLWGALVQMLPMLAICYLIFYFMVIRPQESKNKQHKTLLESLKRGDSVVTTTGIIAKVAGVEKDHVLLELAPNVKVKFLVSAIARREGESTASKAA